ncbi:MAG: serine/threonine protein kinase [Chloroflexota bacterium]
MSNRKLGKYEITSRLGRGGMAEVYRAYHASLDRYVAIKVLHAFLAEDNEFSTRFGKEAQNIARLKHPHIVQVYDFEYDEATESYYMVMELINGETLKDRLLALNKSGKTMPLDEALRITREAASALAYAHKSSMIHRDVKPANLMLDSAEQDRIVLTDFGIAKMVTGAQLTISGGLVGTPAYMSPEQGVGETGDERSDLYSLGVILFQMLTGRLPYDADTPLALILKHMNDPIPSVRDINKSVPAVIDDIIARLMAKSPGNRYPNAEALIDDLRQLEADLPRQDDTPVNLFATQVEAGSDAIEQPTLPLTPADRVKSSKRTSQTTSPTANLSGNQRGFRIGGCLILFALIVLGGYVVGSQAGAFPAIGFLASETPSSEATPEQVVTETTIPTSVAATLTLTFTPSPSETPSQTSVPATATETLVPTNTATDQPTPTLTATATNTPFVTPSATPNVTQTLMVEQTATTAACTFDYAIIEQQPPDGERGGFFPVNTDYTRQITFLNAGNCTRERNTSLTFITGESFNAGPRIFIREPVPIGGEIEITFEAQLPSRGSVEPISGTWQLRTPGQIPIGDPFQISVMVYDPGG